MLLGSGLFTIVSHPKPQSHETLQPRTHDVGRRHGGLDPGLAFAAQATPTSTSREIPVTSRIDHVVVYEQGAQVNGSLRWR